jgi:hypothetical protein
MRLVKSGYYKNKGFTALANTELQAGKPGCRGVPTWQQEAWHLFLRVKGIEGQTTYDYDLTLSGAELALIVEAALTGSSKDRAMLAQAKAIGAFIREALDAKHKPKDA